MGDINRPSVDVDADTVIQKPGEGPRDKEQLDAPTLTPAGEVDGDGFADLPPIDEAYYAYDGPTLPPRVDPDPDAGVYAGPDAETVVFRESPTLAQVLSGFTTTIQGMSSTEFGEVVRSRLED